MRILIAFALLAISSVPMFAQGNLSRNRYDPNSTANPYGAGNPYDPNSINNPYGRYGSKYSPDSANNPYATNAPRLYDADGNSRGRLSTNPYDPDSDIEPIWPVRQQIFAGQHQQPLWRREPLRAEQPN